MKHKSLFIILALVLIPALAFGIFIRKTAEFAHTPTADSGTACIIVISPGENLNRITAKLHDHGLIRSAFMFKMIARYSKLDKSLQSGEYRLSPDMSPTMILEALSRGKVHLHKVTVPEGYTLRQIAGLLEQAALGDAADFIDAATDAALVQQKGLEGQTFEGYLFPETYYFPKGIKTLRIIEIMVNHLQAVFSPAWHAQAGQLGLSMHQVLTLASIIEKETGDASERSLISSVFHNRLEKGMRLESDPTVIYGIRNFDGNLTRTHLRTRTPYNTYVIRGLPPGPIANPGKASIEAALFPVKTDFLYFVSKNNGSHYFSTSFREHNKAVRKYQLQK